MRHRIDADYLVVGAGAMGMAFTDALVDHADVRVVLVDRRHAPGGHWLDAYPFVRLHQASSFYGAASTRLGGDRVQQHGPERGLHERAGAADICAYYAHLLTDRLLPSGRVQWFPGCDYLGGGEFVSSVSGRHYEVPSTCRVVDARYLSPDIPSRTPAPFEVGDGARVIPVNDLVRLDTAPSQYVVVGSGKTATDAVIWLLDRGVDPGAICWVRPREPWMLNRAVVQPAPEAFLGMVADTMQTAAGAASLEEVFLGLEAAGVMLRIDPSRLPTMARAPTLGTWELDLLRSVENVVHGGHLRRVDAGRLTCDKGSTTTVARDAVVVHCAATGLKQPPRVHLWGPGLITLQPVRTGFPCFGAALAGYVEATRRDDAEKNRLCPPTPYGNTLLDWGRMQLLGGRASAGFGAEPDIRAWANQVAINPARVPADQPPSAALDGVLARLEAHLSGGLARLAELCGPGADPLTRSAW